jgi:hypothetical protein
MRFELRHDWQLIGRIEKIKKRTHVATRFQLENRDIGAVLFQTGYDFRRLFMRN